MEPATPHPDGAYRYLPAGGAYSAGVAAEPGHALIGLHLPAHAPLEEALAVIDAEVAARDLPATSLAALHLRIPEVMTADEFGQFNERYLELLDGRGLLVDGASPIARTNVAPLFGPPSEAGVFAAFLAVPREDASGDFVVAGVTEAVGGNDPEHIAAFGDVTDSGLHTKALTVLEVLIERLRALGADGDDPTTVDVYSAYQVDGLAALLPLYLPACERVGFVTYPSRPPVTDVEFELDCLRVSEWHVVGAR